MLARFCPKGKIGRDIRYDGTHRARDSRPTPPLRILTQAEYMTAGTRAQNSDAGMTAEKALPPTHCSNVTSDAINSHIRNSPNTVFVSVQSFVEKYQRPGLSTIQDLNAAVEKPKQTFISLLTFCSYMRHTNKRDSRRGTTRERTTIR